MSDEDDEFLAAVDLGPDNVIVSIAPEPGHDRLVSYVFAWSTVGGGHEQALVVRGSYEDVDGRQVLTAGEWDAVAGWLKQAGKDARKFAKLLRKAEADEDWS